MIAADGSILGSPVYFADVTAEMKALIDRAGLVSMATGKKAPMVRIISALAWLDVKGATNRLLVAGAARWSLTSNAVQHNRVLEICQEEAISQPKGIAENLQEIIKKAKAELEERQK